MSTRLLLAALLLVPAASAQLDYLPLQVGNQWIYRSSAGGIMQWEVTRSAEFQGRLYYLLQGHPGGDAWLRRDENGSVQAYDPGRAQEQVWWAFLNPLGQTYVTFVPGSNTSPALVSSTKALYWGPIGWFNWALEIQYPGIFQVGIYRELFLPYVGLVHREQGGGGPSLIAWDLIYLRSGGVTYVTEQNVTFGLTLDRYSYRTPADMVARFTLRNYQWDPLKLDFPSGQIYDFTLANDKGDIVYRWSEGRAFPQVVHTETYEFGERNYAVLVPLSDKASRPLPPGKYVAQAWLTTTPPESFRASAGFEITAAP